MLAIHLYACVAVGFLLLNAWFSKKRVTVHGTGDVLMLTWFYYAFSASIDRLFGLHIEGVEGQIDLNGPSLPNTYFGAICLYLMWAIGFFTAYTASQHLNTRVSSHPLRSWKKRPQSAGPAGRTSALPARRTLTRHRSRRGAEARYVPPLTLLLLVHAALLAVVLQSDYLATSRTDRLLFSHESLIGRLTLIAITVVRSFDLLYLMRVRSRKRMWVVAVISSVFGLATGGRLEVVSIMLVLILRLRLSFSRMKFISLLIVFVLAMAGWKSAHQFYLAAATGSNLDRGVFDSSEASLTDIESYASVMVLCNELGQPCPWHLGRTYTWDVIQTILPRELRSAGAMAPSVRFAWEHTPERAARGIGTGYSAIAEAWTNFGLLGPLVIGLAIGVLSSWVDHRPRDVLFIVFALIAFRYFRSDAASLLKSSVVIVGGSMVLAAVLYKITGQTWRAASTGASLMKRSTLGGPDGRLSRAGPATHG